jgi:hypothetical protein
MRAREQDPPEIRPTTVRVGRLYSGSFEPAEDGPQNTDTHSQKLGRGEKLVCRL